MSEHCKAEQLIEKIEQLRAKFNLRTCSCGIQLEWDDCDSYFWCPLYKKLSDDSKVLSDMFYAVKQQMGDKTTAVNTPQAIFREFYDRKDEYLEKLSRSHRYYHAEDRMWDEVEELLDDYQKEKGN